MSRTTNDATITTSTAVEQGAAPDRFRSFVTPAAGELGRSASARNLKVKLDNMIDESSLDDGRIEALVRQVVTAHLDSAHLASPYVAKSPFEPISTLIIDAGIKPEQATQALQLIINGFEQGANAKVDSLTATKAEKSEAQTPPPSESRLFSAAYHYGWRADEEPHPRQIEQAKKLKVLLIVTGIMMVVTLLMQFLRN